MVLEGWYTPMIPKYMLSWKTLIMPLSYQDWNNVLLKSKHGPRLMIWNWMKTKQKFFTYHLNSEKTSPLTSVNIANVPIQPANSARNLGVIVTNDLSMDVYINNLCRSASFAFYKIGRIPKLLDAKSTEILVHAFITCHLVCNSLLCGLPDSHISQLQRIQNYAARLVTRTRFSDHTASWYSQMPVKFRIMYKILLLTYKCLHGLASDYITDF